jgi:CTP synthase
MGIQPDAIVCRAKDQLTHEVKDKISRFCNIPQQGVISDPDVKSVYQIPLILEEQGLPGYILGVLHMSAKKPDLSNWKKLEESMLNGNKEVTIAITGKYTALHDSYVSIIESLNHACAMLSCKLNIKWIETTEFDEKPLDEKLFEGVDGLVVPGGFGGRGTEGKIKCVEYARKNNLPFLGLCYGMQLAVVEYARNICAMKGANTTEVDPKTKYPVIDILPDQKKGGDMGGSMRLGSYPAILKEGTIVKKLYGKKDITERHRHRYEVNPKYISIIEKKGLVFSGTSPDKSLMEFCELPSHPYFVATQAHPEFKSRPGKSAPLFYGFISAVKARN